MPKKKKHRAAWTKYENSVQKNLTPFSARKLIYFWANRSEQSRCSIGPISIFLAITGSPHDEAECRYYRSFKMEPSHRRHIALGKKFCTEICFCAECIKVEFVNTLILWRNTAHTSITRRPNNRHASCPGVANEEIILLYSCSPMLRR